MRSILRASPPFHPSAAPPASGCLNRLLVRRAGDDAIVSVGHPMKLPPWSMPQPDFMLLKARSDDYSSHHPGAGDVLLVVEVVARRPHRFREPVTAEGRFASVEQLEAPFTVAVQGLPQVSIASAEIWP